MDAYFDRNIENGTLSVKAFSAAGEKMASGCFAVRELRFGGEYVRALTVGGLETGPQFRRQGLIREMIADGEEFGRAQGASIAVLHPFSFAFYRKFGYERVSDTVIMKFPLSAIDFVPFFRGMEPLSAALVPAFIAYFDRFSARRNLFFRPDPENLDLNGVFVLRDGDNVTAHLKLENRFHFDGVNRNAPDGLFVKQLGFLSPAALTRVLGFLRMFEGEQTDVIICDAGPVPELDSFLKNYMHTEYVLRPDIMAKVLDTEKALTLVRYAEGSGEFSIRVVDNDPRVGGTFSVSVGAGNTRAVVRELASTASAADITVSPQALAKLIFGFDVYTPETAAYLPGVTVTASSDNALRAFPKQINGWFEHF